MTRLLRLGFLVIIISSTVCGGPVLGALLDPTLLLGYQNGANNNPHNLSRLATHGRPQAVNDGSINSSRICVFCHTPHGSAPQTTLWNRPDPANMGSFPLYGTNLAIDDPAIVNTSQYKLNGVDGVEYPNGSTKLCLSCHDGATALGEMLNSTSISMTSGMGSAYVFDGVNLDLSTSHPVSFVYDATVIAYINAGGGKSGYQAPSDPDVRLDGQNRMQCTTCHNPHQDTRSATSYTLPFWANFNGPGNENTDYDETCSSCHTSDYNPASTPPNPGHPL